MPSSEMATDSLVMALFGPMQVQVQGALLPPFRSRKALWLLALLTLHHERPVEREWLAGTLWPDLNQSQAFANLRPVLSELRRALLTEGQRLQSPDRSTLVLDLTDAEVDILRFDAAIKSGKPSDLERAVTLYSGPLLEGCIEEWVFQDRAAREQDCLRALQKLGDAALTVGDHEKAVRCCQRAVGMDPWCEEARRGWMEALAKKGDANAALQVYRQFVEFLKEDPHAAPDEQTTALYQRLRTEVRQRAVKEERRETASVSSVKGYLSHPLTELVGREDERLEVGQQLRRSRLVTLTGMGGIGKTRLAREVAHEVVREYPDGVWLVGLESLTEDRLVIQQVASVLGLQEERDRTPLQRVTEHLRRKRLLLVLDNCEHLLQASAQVAAHLLQCPGVRILATSREALGITGETVWSVPALAVPDTEHLPQGQATLLRVVTSYESVQLFVERAQAVQKTFDLTGTNARMVAQACQQLEGIPLAIELAAARVRALTVEQIVSRLENHLGLLTGGSRTAQSRQQTLRATLDWSYGLLTEAERSLLKRLSVFAGGCTMEAAEAVCRGEGVGGEQVLDVLTSLVDKSLVVFEEREAARGRYRLLEMVRQYAAEGLQASVEAEQVKTRHRDWFLDLAEAAEPQLKGAEQADWLERLEREHNNLRVALARCSEAPESGEAELRLAGALALFWEVYGHYEEGRATLSQAFARADGSRPTAVRARALTGAGRLAFQQADYAASRNFHAESLEFWRTLQDQGGIAQALYHLGDVADWEGNLSQAKQLLTQSLQMSRELQDKRGISRALLSLGNVAREQSDYEEAKTLFAQATEIEHELEDVRSIGLLLHLQGDVAQEQGDFELANSFFEESLALRRAVGDKQGVAAALQSMGLVAYYQGDYEAAKQWYEQSLAIKQELGDRWGTVLTLLGLGGVLRAEGTYPSARALLEQSLEISRELGSDGGISFSLSNLGSVAEKQGDYEAARAYHEESLQMWRGTDSKRGVGIALQCLGSLAETRGDAATAQSFYQDSMEIFSQLQEKLGIIHSLEGFARLCLRKQPEYTARLLGAGEALRQTIGSPLPPAEREKYHQVLAALRERLDEEVFTADWNEGRAMTLEQAVAYALEAVPHLPNTGPP